MRWLVFNDQHNGFKKTPKTGSRNTFNFKSYEECWEEGILKCKNKWTSNCMFGFTFGYTKSH